MQAPSLARAAAATIVATALSTTLHAAPAQLPDLPGTTTHGGISIADGFYQELAQHIETHNAGRIYLEHHQPFTDLVTGLDVAIQGALGNLGFLENLSVEAVVALICSVAPSACPYAAILEAAALLLCGGGSATFEVETIPASAFGTFRVLDVRHTASQDLHTIELDLQDVGTIFVTRTKFGVVGDCFTQEDSHKSLATYDDLTYRVQVDLSTPTPVVSATLLTQIDSATPWTFQVDDLSVSGENLVTQILTQYGEGYLVADLEAWATVNVPLALQTFFETVWTPYLPTATGLLDLSATPQNDAFAENLVQGVIDPPIFLELGTSAGGARVQASYVQGHSAILRDPQAAYSIPAFQASSALPDLAGQPGDGTGMFYLDQAAIQHAAKGAVVSAVGYRSPSKDGGAEPMHVTVPFSSLAPAMGAYTVAQLLGYDMVNQALQPSPAGSVPLSDAQVIALCEAPCTSCLVPTKIGDLGLGAGRIEIEIHEVERNYAIQPFGAFSGAGGEDHGIVWHTVGFDVSLKFGSFEVLNEGFVAELGSRVRLSHLGGAQVHELGGTQTMILSLTSVASGLPWTSILGDVPSEPSALAAPVSFLMRGLFGVRAVDASQPDSRFFYLMEALAGPMVERSAMGFVRLPGLDFPAFGVTLGYPPAAEPYFADCDPGIGVDRPRYCARYQRWGSRAGVDALGSPLGTMLAIEVEWIPKPTNGVFDATTAVQWTTAPLVVTPQGMAEFPALHDFGYAYFDYESSGSDQANVMNALGHRTGPFLIGGGRHYVCASPAAYAAIRTYLDLHTEYAASLELVPYKGLADPANCPGANDNPVKSGAEDDGTPYEIWTFESAASCGRVKCDGRRVGIYWMAPLFDDCGGDYASVEHDFVSDVAPVRGGPDEYVLQAQSCVETGGPGGHVGPID